MSETGGILSVQNGMTQDQVLILADEAAKIAIGVIKDFLETHPDVEVFFFGRPDTMEYYEKEAKRQGLR